MTRHAIQVLLGLSAVLLLGCASNPWRLEISNFNPAAGFTETFRFTRDDLVITRENDFGRPTKTFLRRNLTPEEEDVILRGIGLFHQAHLEKSYTCRNVEDGQVLRISYQLNGHSHTTTLKNVYTEPVGTLIETLLPLLPEEPRLTYFMVNRRSPGPGEPPPAPLPPCHLGSAPNPSLQRTIPGHSPGYCR